MLFKFCVFLCLAGYALSAFQFNPENKGHNKFDSETFLNPNSTFQGTLDYLKNVTSLSKKPCASFYEYSCGNYSKHYEEDWTYPRMDGNNQRHILAVLHKKVSRKEMKPVRLAKIFFQKCLEKRNGLFIPKTSSKEDSMTSTPKSSEKACLFGTQQYMKYAYERIFINSVAQGSNYTLRTREKLREMVRYIILGFRSMIHQVTWLTPNSLAKASLKLDYMAINLMAQNISMNDTALEAYYQPLDFSANDSMAEIEKKIESFKQQRPENFTDRYRLYDSADMVNAHYVDYLNSINIPLGIVQTPLFNIDWPMEWNFGALGFIIGHEISHGFDNGGVQYDEVGQHIPWLEPASQKAFNDSAECLVEEYSKFCDVDDTPGKCLDGRFVLRETIADVAGVHASFRGFQLWKDTVGKQPGLPATSGALGHLEENQLFFLAQPQLFCAKFPTQDLDHVHPPNKYRVRGPLPNLPAFSNAYNCKAGDEYAPKEHCNIWITPAMHKEFMLRFMKKSSTEMSESYVSLNI